MSLSSINFTPDELNLLNKGLMFALPPVNPPIEEIVTAIQCNTTYTSTPVKQKLIPFSTCVLSEVKSNLNHNKDVLRQHNLVKSIKEKDVIISKADKGNSMVVIDSDEYLIRMELMMSEGSYTER